MLRGLIGEYFDHSKGEKQDPMLTESNIVNAVVQRYETMEQISTPWRSLWENTLRLFFPTLNNVQIDGTGGEVRINEIYSDEGTQNVYTVAKYMHSAMFPESYPWFGGRYTDQGGRPIDAGKLPTVLIRHADDAVAVMRAMLHEGDFNKESLQNVIHSLVLGNAPMRAIPVGNRMLKYKDSPVHRMNVQRDNVGDIFAVSWLEVMEKWQIMRDYGPEGYKLFEVPLGEQADPEFIRQYSQIYGSGSGFGTKGGHGSSGTSRPLGTVSSIYHKEAEEVIKVLLPNNMASGIPGAGRVFPEMEYVCYLVTAKTGRLLDVEMYPTIPVGVARDIHVVGEEYARGLCGRLLPSMAVLNNKKRSTLKAESKMLNGPLGLIGPGFIDKRKRKYKENEILPLKAGTSLAPIFDPSSVFRQKQTLYEMDRVNLEKAMMVDKTEVAMADRMTLGEFTQRRDIGGLGFQSFASSYYKDCILPLLKATLNYAYMSDRLPPPPMELLSGELRFELEMFSTFTYGQHSEKGMNFTRALAPLGDAFSIQPELLDWIDFKSVLKRNFANYQLGNSLNTQDEVARIRRERAEMAALQSQNAGGGGQPDGVTKGREAAMAQREQAVAATAPDSDLEYVAN